MIDENPCPRDTGRGFTIFYKKRHLYSPTDPKESADRRAESCTIPEQAIVFLPSPLLFYGFETVIKKLPSSSIILSVEADQKLFSLSLSRSRKEVIEHPSLRYVRTESKEKLLSVLEEMDLSRYRKAVMIRLSGGFALSSQLYRDMYAIIEQEIRRYWQNRMTMIYMSKLWFKNLFKNLPTLFSTLSIQSLAISKPIVVTGAGESLEESIALLQSIRDKIHILSVDTALPVLQGNGLLPDSICIVEAQLYNVKDFIGFSESRFTLFYDLSSFSSLIRTLPGPRYPFFSRFAESALFTRMEAAGLLPLSLPPLGSVGITALYLACHLTEYPVFFTGLDFSYTLGKPHARGALSHIEVLRKTTRTVSPDLFIHSLNRPLITVNDKNNAAVHTDLVLHSYLKGLQELTSKNERIFDLAPRGLPSGAERVRTKEEVLETIHTHSPAQSSEPQNGQNVSADLSGLKELLALEIASIDSFINSGTLCLQRRAAQKEWDAMIDTLLSIDYIYSFFPDAEQARQADSNFIKRALVSAYDFRSTLRHILDYL
jgi:hypothetical protein